MNGSLYIGATGLKGLAEGMNVVTNNLANANTIGYKQQSLLFSDLMYEGQAGMGGWWGAQGGSYVALGQTGKGVQVDSIRTLFTQGGYEMGIETTDLSINGKGFFEVTTPDGQTRYTRAGNFRFDQAGFLKLPGGAALNGFAVNDDGSLGPVGPIQANPMGTSPPKATSQMTLALNLGSTEDRSADAANPYFGLVKAWNGAASPPLSAQSYGYAQGLRVYDATGAAQDLTIYVDGAPGDGSGNKTMEFVVGKPAQAPATGGDMMLSGTLTFNSAGQLTGMSAFTPTGGNPNDLTQWVPAALVNGAPQFSVNGQSVTLNMGLTAPGGWVNPPANAAAVGASAANLPSMGSNATHSPAASTAYAGASSQRSYIQDGYGTGSMNGLDVKDDGSVVASYTNGQSKTLFQIPVCRFTSEDGLRREGGNLFSSTADAGQMERGRAGTENYGKINARTLETSNVDMAREMVNMIVTQRGFQSNSKVITTADTMLQRAIEMKR